MDPLSALLCVHGLRVEAPGAAGPRPLVDGIDLELERGETLALVGESGAGKTLAALALLRLVPPPARLAGGRVSLDGRELGALDEAAMRAVRGRRIALVPQDPAAALHPVRRVGDQIAEVIRVHRGERRRSARALAAAALAELGVVRDDVPHRLSGGQRQRAALAIALAGGPELLVADEPTSALDATVKAQILDLLEERRRRLGLAVLLISHDLGAVARLADRVEVMHAGRIVERGSAVDVLTAPRHPHTAALVAALPRIAAAGSAPP